MLTAPAILFLVLTTHDQEEENINYGYPSLVAWA